MSIVVKENEESMKPVGYIQDEEKFKELILYISQKCATDPRFGATKLNKILYFADFFTYAETGKPITGVAYQKLPNGPAPRRLLPVRTEMKNEGILAVQELRLTGGKRQVRTVNLRDPNLESFSGYEIAVVDSIIDNLKDDNADTVSSISHQMIGWQIVSMYEDIPYSTVFLSNEPLSQSEIERGKEIERQIAGRAS